MAREKLEVDTLRRLNRLCELEARPPTIQAILPGLKEVFIKTQWVGILGKNPPRGPLPLKEDFYFASYQAKLQASYYVSCWKRLLDAKFHYVDAYIGAFEQYQEAFGDECLMTFDRAWCLARAVASDHMMIELVKCDHCESTYIHNSNDLVNHKFCPVCRVYGLRDQKRQKAEDSAIVQPIRDPMQGDLLDLVPAANTSTEVPKRSPRRAFPVKRPREMFLGCL